MAYNVDDGVNRYRTDDGHTFNTEKDAEDHYKRQVENAAAAEAHAKYLAWVKKVLTEAWGLINKGDNAGAIDFLLNHDCQSSQLAYPLGWAYENLGKYESAKFYYSEFLQKYIGSNNMAEENSYNNVLYARARIYTNLGEWKSVKSDCNRVIYAEHSYDNKREDVLRNIFYYRGLSFENLGNKKRSIGDFKLALDFGNTNAGQKLSGLGISYSPKKPPKSFFGNGFLAFLFAVFTFTGIVFILLTSEEGIKGMAGVLGLVLILGLSIFVFKFWIAVKYIVNPLLKKITLPIFVALFLTAGVRLLSDFYEMSSVETGSMAVVVGSGGWLYEEPRYSSKTIKIIRPDEEVLILGDIINDGKGYKFRQVEHEGEQGYIRHDDIRRKKAQAGEKK
jgi:tetratricopeptide (TPR) repeat protein